MITFTPEINQVMLDRNKPKNEHGFVVRGNEALLLLLWGLPSRLGPSQQALSVFLSAVRSVRNSKFNIVQFIWFRQQFPWAHKDHFPEVQFVHFDASSSL